MQTRFGLRPLTADPTSVSAIKQSALNCCPFIWIGLMILRTFRLVLAPALKLPILGHGVEMAMPPQLGGLYRFWFKESPEIIAHGSSKTKTGKHLTIRFGIEPDFVDKFIFHWNALLHYASSGRRLANEISSLK